MVIKATRTWPQMTDLLIQDSVIRTCLVGSRAHTFDFGTCYLLTYLLTVMYYVASQC
jgi:hypothetical protein